MVKFKVALSLQIYCLKSVRAKAPMGNLPMALHMLHFKCNGTISSLDANQNVRHLQVTHSLEAGLTSTKLILSVLL